MSRSIPIAELARAEVIALHAFFVEWFRGAEADFGLCEGAFAADFRMVTPDGPVRDLDQVLGGARAARGTMGRDFRIDIVDPRPVWTEEDAVLLEYVERQYREGRWTSRRSTALFTRRQSAPRGVEWRHLQETWMPAEEVTDG